MFTDPICMPIVPECHNYQLGIGNDSRLGSGLLVKHSGSLLSGQLGQAFPRDYFPPKCEKCGELGGPP